MEINDAHLEARIQLPIKSKPIECLMYFNQKNDEVLNQEFVDQRPCEAVVIDNDNQQISLLKSDNNISEAFEYANIQDSCKSDSNAIKSIWQNIMVDSVRISHQDKEVQCTNEETNHSSMVDASVQYDMPSREKEQEFIRICHLDNSVSDTLNLSEISVESQQILIKTGVREQLNQKRNKESYEIRLKSSDNELNEMLKDILKNNIKNTCDLRNRVKTLELQLSNSKITIQSLK